MELNDHLIQVFEKAKQNELDGKELYLEELDKTDDPGLKRILQMLADAEQDHYNVFEQLQKNNDVDEIKATSISEIKTMFSELKASGKSIVTTKDHAEFYKKVQLLEQEAVDAYTKEAEDTTDPKLKEIFTELALEEKRHVVLMEGFYDLCMNPETWVENAEFNNFEEF